MKTALFAAIFLMMAASTFAGRITPWGDPNFFYPNSGKIDHIDLFFNLDTKLPAGHVMRITLPFSTAPALSATVGALAVYAASTTTRGTWTTTTPTPISSTANATAVRNSSAAPFHTYFTFGNDLAAATNYVFRITLTSSPTDVGFLGYIQMETMSPANTVSTASGTGDQAITYDLNNAFAPVHIFPAPGTNMTFNISSDANTQQGGQTSMRQLSIIPSQNFFYWPTIQLNWDNTAFTISNLTSIDTGVNTSAVTPLTAGSGTNQYWSSSTSTTLNIYHNAPLLTNQTVKYNFTTANPAGTVSQTIIFSVKIFHRYNMNLTDVSTTQSILVPNTSAPAAGSSTPTMNAYQILLSWGIDPQGTLASNTALSKVFSIYATPATNQVFQALRYVFGLSAALTTGTYTVTLTVCNSTGNSIINCDVLENSIVSTFTGATCKYLWGPTPRQIACTGVTSIAATGNYIAARVWYQGGITNTNYGVLSSSTSTTFPSTFGSDTYAGNIAITQPSNAAFSISGGFSTASSYNKVTYNYLPLVNINGNGPLAMVPVTGTKLQDASTDTSTLWNAAPAGNLLASSTATQAFAAYTIPTSGTASPSASLGGIFGTPAAQGTKYHVALFTSAVGTGASGGTPVRGSFTNGNAAIAATQIAGIDLFFNPNLYGQTGTSTTAATIINNCWASLKSGKLANTDALNSNTPDDNTHNTAHCYTKPVSDANANYLRLRQAITTVATAGAPIGASLDSVPATGPAYLTFYWETAVSITSNYTGASLKADNNVGDFYGLMWAVTYATGASTVMPIRTGTTATSPVDAGELPLAQTGLSSFVVGTPFMWSQMILGPFGTFTTTTTSYYKQKTMFLSGYYGAAQSTGAADQNGNSILQMVRIRGTLNATSGSGDLNMSPTSGKIAIFIGTATGKDVFNPLGSSNVTNLAGNLGYNAAAVTGAPLISNGAIRCWNSGVVGNCVHERYGRALPAATPFAVVTGGVTGTVGALDLYQILTSDADYSKAFSISFLINPIKTAKVLADNFVRFGFQNTATGYYMIQAWDQPFDFGSTLAASGNTNAYTTLGGTAGSSAPVQYPATGTSVCLVPYVAATATSSSVRVSPAATDLDNSVYNTTLNVLQGAASATAVASASKQGYVSWCVQWNIKASTSFAINSTNLESATVGGDKCAAFDYYSPESPASGTPYIFYCVVCPLMSGLPTTGYTVNLASMTTGPATQIYNHSSTNIGDDNGALKEWSYCPAQTGTAGTNNGYVWQPQVMTAVATNSSLNINGQKIVIQFTTPSGLYLADSIKLTGKKTDGTGDDTTFPYFSLDTSYSLCRLAPASTKDDFSTYLSCTATAGSGVITISGVSVPNTNTNTSWYLYIWGANGNAWAATYPTTTSFIIATLKSTYIVDQSSTTTANLVNWTLANTTTTTFSTSNVQYQRSWIGARGWFRFDLSWSTRNWFAYDKVVLNLDAVMSSPTNVNASVVKCRIADSSDNIVQTFQSCTLNPTASPPTLTIVAMAPSKIYPADFAASGIRVYLDNMVTLISQTNKTISGNVVFAGAATPTAGTTQVLTKNNTGTDVTQISLTTGQQFPATGATITKWWAAANDFQDIVFTLSSNAPFNSTCRITIVFPSYYNPGLTTRSALPYCTVNGAYSQCLPGVVTSTGTTSLFNGQRQLTIFGSSTSINNGTLTIRVNGISAPFASYATETFWIQINGDNTENNATIIYAGAVSDTAYSAPSTAVLPLHVIWSGVASTATRSFTTFTWSFYLNNATATLATTQAVQVIFPEIWGMAWGLFTPQCTLGDFTNTTASYSAAANISYFGNLVTMNVTTASPAGAVINVTCSNVRTVASDTTYRSQDVSIRVVDANGGVVALRSAPSVHNVNFTSAFAKGSSQTYLAWGTASSSTSPLSLTAGTYNLILTITVAKSSRSFTISPSDSRFSFVPTTAPFWIVTGATVNVTQLGTAQTTPIGLYALTYTISDNSSTYVAPSSMWVSVNSNPQTITPSPTALSAYFSSSSLSSTAPLVFDLTAFPPFTDITITPTAPNLPGTTTANTNFTFTPASLKLTPASPKGYFTFTSTAAATVVGSASYTFALSGTNMNAYTMSGPVTVSLTSDPGTGSVNTPSLNVSADTTDQGLATSKILTFTLTSVSQATIYWCVTLQGQAITDATAIQTAAQAQTAYNPNSANQAQYFTTYQVTSPAKSPSTVSVSNLFPQTGYTVSAVAVSNTNKSSVVTQFTFVTGTNNAVIQRWLFNFTAYPTQAQRQTLLCQISQTLAVPAINVRNVNGEICGNTTAFFATQNSTGDLAIYLYPLQSNSDTTMTATNLQTNLNSTSALAALNTAISAGSSGSTFATPVLPDFPTTGISRNMPSISLPTSATSTTTSSIYISVTASNDTGFLFMVVCANSSTTPTAIQIKQAAANMSSISGMVSGGLQVFYYYPGQTVSNNFTGLTTGTSYNVYLVASNNDPSFLQNFTSVTSFSTTTAGATTPGTTGSPIGVILSVMTVFASVISLMFF